jgi:hypothetical protein
MIAFDAAGRETCIVRPSRTNTPLQALVTLNDPTFVEAARKLAERVLRDGGASPEDRIAYAFRLVLGREPNDVESSVLLQSWQHYRSGYVEQPEAALKLLSVGESPRDESLDAAELAAYAALANLLLNLDEALTRQ